MKRFVITDFGAVAGSEEVQTKVIQNCLDHCRDLGGGEVVVPTGTFVIGSLQLYSNMTLRLQSGAVLLGSQDHRDYQDFKVPTTIQYLHDDYYRKLWHLPSYYFYAMITAFEAENIRIIGEPGALFNGQDTFDENGEEQFRGPMGILMTKVKNLHLAGYTFENSANWSHTLEGCTGITVENVTIKGGHDGFNLHHSQAIKISDCRLECGDDCFAGYDVQQLLVEGCYVNTACNGLRIGGENLLFQNCVFRGPGRYPHLSESTYYTHAIFKYYAIRPDVIPNDADNIVLQDCLISEADKLFFYDHGKESLNQNNRPLRALTLENVQVSGIRHTSLFKGNGEAGKLTLKNVSLTFAGPEAFLEIDEMITLELQQVDFVNPTTIKIASDRQLVFQGLTTLKVNAVGDQ